MTRVAGLDLSLTGAAAVVIPERWEPPDWQTLPRMVCGHPLKSTASEADKLGRLVRIRIELLQFLAEYAPDIVFVEGYAFSRRSSSAHALAELGGCVKVACLEYGFPVRVVTASACRKTFLGSVPARNSKTIALQGVYSMGARELSDDECDAWLTAQHGRGEVGLPVWTVAKAAA